MIRRAERGIGVVPQGGLTGLVAPPSRRPSVPNSSSWCDRMSAIRGSTP